MEATLERRFGEKRSSDGSIRRVQVLTVPRQTGFVVEVPATEAAVKHEDADQATSARATTRPPAHFLERHHARTTQAQLAEHYPTATSTVATGSKPSANHHHPEDRAPATANRLGH